MCLVVLIFMITSSVLAAGTISIDSIPGGADLLGSDSEHQTGKFKSNFVTLEGTFKDFKYGIDYGIGTDEFKAGDIILSDNKYDFNMVEYKFGAQVLNHERVKLALVISQLQIEQKNSKNKINQNGTLLGCDANVLVSEKLSLDGYLGYSLFGADYEENGIDYDPAYLMALKARINYAVAEHIALSLGLRETWCIVNNYKIDSLDDLGRGIGGFSIGVKYTF
jgi:hypothetical protein